ncbi:MAG TPA: MFS transporter [Actinomycetes bacterium]|jgi:EmrB/QacA subfamily drug resistance transporter|nr:MFS transporter [Actinomycetes bacterium]
MHDTHHPARDTDEPRAPREAADPRRWKALAVISVAQFMLILDLTVVNVALPDLGADLDLSRTAFTWAVSAYGLVFGGLLLLGGRLADVFGTRTMMLAGLVSFTLASLACGLAQNQTVLLGGRVGQGVGAALLSPAALAAITSSFHGEERNKALSVWASLGGVGFTAGVLIGGILTSGPGWRWVFFINVPVGLVLLATIPAVVRPRHPDRAARLDVLGAVAVTAATGSFIYGLINAGDAGWADLGTLGPIAAAIVLYGVFVVVERTVPTPLLRLNLLARRPIAAGAFLMLVAAGVLIADLFLGSQYLQHLRGLSALETGLFFLPPALALMIGAITAGRLVGTIGTRPVAVVALALVAIGNALLIGVSAAGNVYVEALPGVTVFALGGGPLFVCATTSALGRASLHEAGLVSGVVQTFNQLGAAICVAVASTVATAGLTPTPSIEGFTDAFTVFTVVAAVAAVLSLRLVPSGTPQMTGAPHAH